MEENKNDEQVVVFSENQLDKIDIQERAAIEAWIDTARRYPRNVKLCTEEAIQMVSLDKEIAESCSYSIPRKDKDGKPINIIGKSVHLARILAQCWGNIRVVSRVKEINATHVVSEAVCVDLQKIYVSGIEIRRSIIGKAGRFNNDMIVVTGNASNAIAYRNALLNVIPESISNLVMKAAQRTITGDLSTEQKVITRRNELIQHFKDQYGATEAEILWMVGKHAISAIGADEIVFMIGIKQAMKDNDLTPETAFGRDKSIQKTADKLKDLASKGYEKVVEKAEKQQQGQTGEPPKRQGRPPKQPDGSLSFEQK